MKLIAIVTAILILISGFILRSTSDGCHERRLTSNGEYAVNLVQCSDASGLSHGSLELKQIHGESLDLLSFKGSGEKFQFEFHWNERRALTITYLDLSNQLSLAEEQVKLLGSQISVRMVKRNTLTASNLPQSVLSR